jgi:predicted Ser/Thr protein kinase
VRGSVTPSAGDTFGGYTIESELGRGGMGTVYLATHDRLERNVALKVLAPELVHDERFRARFLRESQLAASLDHPNVIPIYDADEVDGVLYLAMRYVQGQSLQTLLRERGRLSPAETEQVAGQIAGALDAAHAAGLVHRDVKPANILLTAPGGHAYLCDFGLAKRTSSQGMTHAGSFLGTVDYSAPEQIRGQAVDGRADVYSLGCVVFHCLAGQPPYVRDSEVEALNAHLTEPPPSLTTLRPDLPRLDAVIATAMAKDPDERYATAGALVAGLKRALASPPADAATRVAPTGPAAEPETRVVDGQGRLRQRSRVIAIPAAVLVLVLAGAAAGVLATRGGDGSSTKPPSPRAQRAFVDGVEAALARSSAGRRQIAAALADGLSCRLPPDAMDNRLQQVIANRRGVLASLRDTAPPTQEAARSLALLRRALVESVSVDTHYRKAFRATTICPLPESADLAAAREADGRATAAKQAFVVIFNPLAREFHRRTWLASQF